MIGEQEQVFSGNGLPNVTPEADVAVWVDEDTGIMYPWYDGEWHT